MNIMNAWPRRSLLVFTENWHKSKKSDVNFCWKFHPAPNYAKIDPRARKPWNTEIFHPSSRALSRRHKKSVHCVRHPIFTEQQHQPGIVQPKRPFGMGDGVGVGLGGMVRTSEEWALSLSGWDVHDHPKWFWRQKSVLMLVPVGSLDWGQRCEWWSLQFVNMICLVWFNSIAWKSVKSFSSWSDHKSLHKYAAW